MSKASQQPAIDPDATGPKDLPVDSEITLVIVGRHFSEDDGGGGSNPIRVTLNDSTETFVWDPEEMDAEFIDSTEIRVTSTPTAAEDGLPLVGGGDLTITVTNGNGAFTPATTIDGITYV